MIARRWAAALAACGMLLAGCGGSGGGAEDVPVVVPGRPGEPATVLPGDEAAARQGPQPISTADTRFLQRMIAHHEQALRMSALADERAAEPAVHTLAERIAVSQRVEIDAMRAQLNRHGADDHGAHRPSEPMPGMATPEQLAELGTLRGAAFDRRFVRLMTVHHEGAITMATEVLGTGTDDRVAQVAQDVIATQTAEIDRMRALQ